MFSGEKNIKNECFRYNESGYDFSTIFWLPGMARTQLINNVLFVIIDDTSSDFF
jgi:hypothetical protein